MSTALHCIALHGQAALQVPYQVRRGQTHCHLGLGGRRAVELGPGAPQPDGRQPLAVEEDLDAESVPAIGQQRLAVPGALHLGQQPVLSGVTSAMEAKMDLITTTTTIAAIKQGFRCISANI
jgi:hypothetical protein